MFLCINIFFEVQGSMNISKYSFMLKMHWVLAMINFLNMEKCPNQLQTLPLKFNYGILKDLRML